jgi:hypothetical protein
MADRNVRQVAGFFPENGRIMSKKRTEVKKKESYKRERETERGRQKRELVTFGLRQNVARQTTAKKEASAGIERGESGKAFARGVEIASALEAQVSAVGVFHQNVIAEFARRGIWGVHGHYPPVR